MLHILQFEPEDIGLGAKFVSMQRMFLLKGICKTIRGKRREIEKSVELLCNLHVKSVIRILSQMLLEVFQPSQGFVCYKVCSAD